MILDLKNKDDGYRALEQGYALIDCSNRTKNLRQNSAVALVSRKINYSVMFRANDKQAIIKRLLRKHDARRVPIIMHAIKLAYVLDPHIESLPGVYICADGHHIGQLHHHLNQILKQKYDKSKIRILPSLKPFFGKRNIADTAAYAVVYKKVKPDLELDISHFKEHGLIE